MSGNSFSFVPHLNHNGIGLFTYTNANFTAIRAITQAVGQKIIQNAPKESNIGSNVNRTFRNVEQRGYIRFYEIRIKVNENFGYEHSHIKSAQFRLGVVRLQPSQFKEILQQSEQVITLVNRYAKKNVSFFGR
ncbi:hypothetical protein SAMN02799624_03591 [Paenibacillus sp. UNC496MF]|nr:hypothetical protein SAMN02799624_03591 [Paenibacillus sp. UNC496MF]